MREVYNIAESTKLFADGDVKVRMNTFKHYNNGNTNDDFIFIFAHMMEGRSTEQKSDLSKKIISRLKSILPDVRLMSMNISDIEKATYCNKTMV